MHFAQVVDKKVINVIVAEQDVIDSGMFGDGWIQTSYNTYGNQHKLGGTPLRGNYAGIGSIYNKEKDAFYGLSPYPSWKLNKNFLWEAPVPMPTDGKMYNWDDPTLTWIENVP